MGAWFPGKRILAFSAVALCAFFIIWRIYQKNTGFISPIVLFLALGYLSIQSWVAPAFPPNHVVHFMDTHQYKIVGAVDAPPIQYPNRTKFILRIETLSKDNETLSVKGKIRVTVAGQVPEISWGDHIAFCGRINRIKNFHNPGGFDYEKYMALKKVWGTAYVSGKALTVFHHNKDKGLFRRIEDARGKIANLIEKSGHGKQTGVLKALIIGNRNSIPQDLRDTFNRAGIGHLLAISGLHIGIVAATAFLFFRCLLSHIHFFLWRAWTKKGAVIFSVIPVFVYGLLSGMSPSTQRAVIMVFLFLLAFLLESEYDPLNTLAIAAMLILVAHPPSLFSISFQLSFVAVLAIIYGLSKIRISSGLHSTQAKSRRHLNVLKKLFYFILVSCFAILGTFPLVMLYFNQISLVGIFANLFIVPLIGFLVVPLGLLSAFLYPLTATGAATLMSLAGVVLEQALYLVDLIAAQSFAAVKTVTPSYFEIVCFYALLWAVLNLTSHPPTPLNEQNSEQPAAGEPSRLRLRGQKRLFRWKPATLVAIFTISLLFIDLCYWLNERFWRADLRVTMIDVGHGSSALLELPYGYNILLDGGGFSSNSIFDVGARIIAPLLWQKKIKTVDALVLSHPNSDHLNGLIFIAEHFNVKTVWSNNEAAHTLSYQTFLDVIQKNTIDLPKYSEIPKTYDINGVHLEIFYPPEDFLNKKRQNRWRNTNNNSLVLHVTFGSTSFLFPGDIKLRAENELVAIAGNRLKSTVLLAPHHGSRTSSSKLFLEKVDPEIVIISAGQRSKFGFPHLSVLQRYQERNYQIFSTAICGAISLATDGKAITLRPTITHYDKPVY